MVLTSYKDKIVHLRNSGIDRGKYSDRYAWANSVNPDQAPLSVSFHHENICYLYNFDPLKPHFYIVKLGFTGVYIIFLFLHKDIYCG